MARNNNITSANSVFMLAIPGVYDSPQQIQGFSADAAFIGESVNGAEVMMGVDGVLSAGFTPAPTLMNVTLQADSPSLPIFETWDTAQQSEQTIFRAEATVLVPSVGRKVTMRRGVLTSATRLPNAGKVLQPRTFTITWESAIPANA